MGKKSPVDAVFFSNLDKNVTMHLFVSAVSLTLYRFKNP